VQVQVQVEVTMDTLLTAHRHQPTVVCNKRQISYLCRPEEQHRVRKCEGEQAKPEVAEMAGQIMCRAGVTICCRRGVIGQSAAPIA
jgi:hypothetical protein